MDFIKALCFGGYLIWGFLGSSQISQYKSLPNINRFAVFPSPPALTHILLETYVKTSNMNLNRYLSLKLSDGKNKAPYPSLSIV